MNQEPKLTLDQQRAQYAWAKSSECSSFIKEYTVVAKSTAGLMMNSGMMQTLAFLKTKNTSEHKALLAHILKWLDMRFLAGNEQSDVLADVPEFGVVMENLQKHDSASYMLMTREIMALLRWIRQFADAHKAMER